MKKVEIIKGTKYGRLTIVQEQGSTFNHRRVLVKCDCGKQLVVLLNGLRRCRTKSCGCLNQEQRMTNALTHGYSPRGKRSSVYTTWAQMIQRCNNPKNKSYSRYGGRGITVCKEWLVFENFLADMGERPAKLSIDRINNDDGYYKENCRWATASQQMLNRRKFVWKKNR